MSAFAVSHPIPRVGTYSGRSGSFVPSGIMFTFITNG